METSPALEKSKPNRFDGEKLLNEIPLGLFKMSADGKLEYSNKLFSSWFEENDNVSAEGKKQIREQILQAAKECLASGQCPGATVKAVGNPDTIIHVFPMDEGTGMGVSAWGVVENLSPTICYQSKLEKKINELSLLCELSKVLSSTLNLEEILQIILTSVTAGQGLGFNRAFLLLLNLKSKMLEGEMAIGPSNPEEAQRIWHSLSSQYQSLEEVLQSYQKVLKEKDVLVNRTVRRLRIPLSDQDHPLIKSMVSKQAFNIIRGRENSEHSLFEILQTEQFAVAPLISKDKMLGVIIADNLITRKLIDNEAVKLLSICAHHASTAIENSQLYQELKEKVDKLAEAKRNVAESTQRLLKVERLSVLGQITSQVAHELRNPLTIIGGFAHSILKKLDTHDSDYEYLKIIAKETERMENILNNVLDFSKPEKFNLEKVNLNELVDQTLEMMESEIDLTKISIVKMPDPEISLVQANPDLIRQALINIFRNSLWAMPQGGILSVVTQKSERAVRIEIKDTGFGISSQHRNNVFDAFFTTRPDACGLGLTVSAEIIKNHGGKIGVDSVEGKGSTFNIELPVLEETRVKEGA